MSSATQSPDGGSCLVELLGAGSELRPRAIQERLILVYDDILIALRLLGYRLLTIRSRSGKLGKCLPVQILHSDIRDRRRGPCGLDACIQTYARHFHLGIKPESGGLGCGAQLLRDCGKRGASGTCFPAPDLALKS